MFKPQIVLCQTATDIEQAIDWLTQCSQHVFGLDTESDQTLEQPKVACLQIATRQRAYLMQIAHLPTIPDKLKAWLANGQYVKVGVDLLTDSRRLQADYGLLLQGFIDIKPLALAKGEARQSMDDLGVKYLSSIGFTPTKSHLSWRTPWSNTRLSARQIEYGAMDAYWSLCIFQALMGQQVITKPPVSLDRHDFCRHLQQVLQSAKKGLLIDKAINIMCNSYQPLVKNYVLPERQKQAKLLLDQLIQEGQLCQKGSRLVYNHPETMRTLQTQVMVGNLQSVRTLLSYIAHPHQPDPQSGETLLDLARRYQRTEIIQLLESSK